MFSLFSSQRSFSLSNLGPCPWYVQVGGALVAVFVLLGIQSGPPEGNVPSVTTTTAAATVETHLPPDGKQIYNTRCMSCHQMNGKGVPGTFPPLSGSDWVTGDKGRLIRLLLGGISGSMEVNGQTYSGVMPPWGGALDDRGIADIATYIRSNFGNEASAVTEEEVAKVRAATKGAQTPWTVKQLKKEANQGIPGDSTSS